MMKDDDFKLLRGFALQTDRQTDICECRVAFVTEKLTQRHPINSLESDF